LLHKDWWEKNSRTPRALSTLARLKLVIVHSHYRPGGVRRVIELAMPHVAGALRPPATEVLLVGGEAPDEAWLSHVRKTAALCEVTCAIEPALGYISEQRARPIALARRIRGHLRRCLAGSMPESCVVWAHNLGLGRNLLLAQALGDICAELGVRLVCHQHDWWFDNRWARWPEMRRTGFRTLDAVARTILPGSSNVRHATINQADARHMRRHFGARAGWLPNPAAPATRPAAARVRRARVWLRQQIGDDAPVWLVPCRLLRRKNMAEALLLTRWLRPEAWLVTTGAMSSADETGYSNALHLAVQRNGWRMRLGVLSGSEVGKPAVEELLAASEVILLTSLQEGFGLPMLEAAAAGRPLIARSLPNIAPDLASFGFRFPQAYQEIMVDVGLFDLREEIRRQAQRWRAWRAGLPKACRLLAESPQLAEGSGGARGVPFSRLTLLAQLEVLAHPIAESWERCAALNPFLLRWRARAAEGALTASRWPREAAKWLGGPAYGHRFAELLHSHSSRPVQRDAGVRVAKEFIRAKLGAENQYPLLWTVEP
jgi:glycosyltransferase involved in cell wall biosynthesis